MIRSPSRILPVVPKKGSVALRTLGCKVNRYEGECIINFFKKLGLKNEDGNPDLVVVNTCVVTKTAESKSRKMIRKLKRRHPNATILITGCLEYYKQDISDGYWLPMSEKAEIADCCFPISRRSRYYLKIEDGCDRFCHYCIIPKIRGQPRSKPVQLVLEEVEYARGLGFPEIVLVGVNIGLYKDGLPNLIRKLSKINDLPRIRISSLEPEFINKDFLSALKDIPFCRHLHIALQHTDTHVLRSMGRRPLDPYRLFDDLKDNFPDLNIGADLIVGYPTESGARFQSMVEFIDDTQIGYLHVFPFSPRPGTRAAEVKDVIPFEEKKRRVGILRELSLRKRVVYAEGYLGRTLEAVVERKNGDVYALSDNYLRMKIEGKVSKNLVQVRPIKINEDQIIAEVI